MRTDFRFRPVRRCAFVIALALGVGQSTLAAASASPSPSASASAVSVHPTAILGTAELARPSASGQAPARQPLPFSRGARRVPRTNSPAAASTGSPPSSLASSLGEPTSLLASFNGVSSRDSAITNFGQEFEPPDQGLCVGNGFVVEMVNSAYTVFRPDGRVVAGPFNVNGPFEEGLTEFTSDPRCYFDRSTHTWFAVILGLNSSFTASTLDIAVNRSGDPTTPWTAYKIDTSGAGGASGPKHAGCPCFGDQPTLGIDSHNLYVTTNDFSIVGPQFYGAEIYAIAKSDLIGGSPSPHLALFPSLRVDGGLAASVQPATSSGAPRAEFFLGSIDPTETFGDKIGVWAMTDAAAVASGGKPTLSSVVLPSEAFGVPPMAEQRGSFSLLESDDDRMQQVQSINGTVWGELGTILGIPGDPVQRAGAAWFAVTPRLAGGLLSAAQISRQGYVGVAGNYLLYPALAVTPTGAGAMVMTLSGSTRYPSAAYATLAPGASAFGPVAVAGRGSGSYDPQAGRWGDYSYAVLDPGGASVWLATEYVPPKSSQTPDGVRDWGTRVFDVTPGGG